MLKFNKIRYKNLQSAGNQFIELDLSRSPTTLIGGHNGAGKSNFNEALAYALFGKPLKKVVLASLLNTTNGKGLLTEVEFEKTGKSYKIVRGMKPNKLEFWVDGELVDQDASTKEYQTKIEYVLGFDYKLFTQVIVLTKEQYVPFMDLSAADRRKVVEDILDISVFSSMSSEIKELRKTANSEISTLKLERTRLEERVAGQKRLINEASANVTEQKNRLILEVEELEKELAETEASLSIVNEQIDSLADVPAKKTKTQEKKREFENFARDFKVRLEGIDKELEFYTKQSNCPTCKQPLSPELIQEKEHDCGARSKEIKDNIEILTGAYQKFLDKAKAVELEVTKLVELQEELWKISSEVTQIKRLIVSKENSLEALEKPSKADDFKSELISMEESLSNSTASLGAKIAEVEDLDYCISMLSDSGVKSIIVKEYIDFINAKLNEYLIAWDFHINITLDENFNDKINAINKENFTYANLSTGQKTRVNLAIWMALLEVSTVKNSVVTNLLSLDEILEPVDAEGVKLFMDVVKDKLPHKNLFVITQRFAEFKDYFRSEVEFKLVNGFTEFV